MFYMYFHNEIVLTDSYFVLIVKVSYSYSLEMKKIKKINRLILLLLYNFEGNEQVVVYPIIQLYTFELACSLFLSMEDPIQVSNLSPHFDEFLKGIIGFSINFPGTTFHKSMKAANIIREEIKMIMKKRKVDLEEKKASPTQDLLSHLLVTSDTNGKFLNEVEIIDNILLLLFAGHDTSRSVLSSVMKYLGQLPEVYEQVLKGLK